MAEKSRGYAAELKDELKSILDYWMEFTPDPEYGGFKGKIDINNQAGLRAPKGSVLNARILWSFAAAYRLNPQKEYLQMADRAYAYINDHFIDQQFGGVFWTVNYKGDPLDTKKQVYAIAFTIYAYSEYYLASKNEEAKQKAIALYHDLVKYSYDTKRGGYFEAFTREWQTIEDLRLSDKDANEKKTMNTHLHVLEAFTTLYKIWPDPALKEKIKALLDDFCTHLINPYTGHLNLFLDEDWSIKSEVISYGHDIEASWLLLEAAEVINDEKVTLKIKELSLKMAEVTLKAIDHDGALWYEYDPATVHLNREKHWWVQAESMVGFFNAWQLSSETRYLETSLANWKFVKDQIIDRKNGEWFWGRAEDGSVMAAEDKVGLWKCPYHNSRACIEIIMRISGLQTDIA